MIASTHAREEPVKILKLGVVICGVLGVVGLAMTGIDRMMEADKLSTIVMLAAYALPIVMGAIAFVRPPFQAWQAGVSLAGFALAAYKLRIWEVIRAFGEAPTGFKLMTFGAGIGVILTIVAVMKPEDGA
jgi:hypothetical protein